MGWAQYIPILHVGPCFLPGANPQGRPLYGTRPDGLMPRHAYTVLQAVEIPGEVWEDPTRMVCLRNPWGRCDPLALLVFIYIIMFLFVFVQSF